MSCNCHSVDVMLHFPLVSQDECHETPKSDDNQTSTPSIDLNVLTDPISFTPMLDLPGRVLILKLELTAISSLWADARISIHNYADCQISAFHLNTHHYANNSVAMITSLSSLYVVLGVTH